MKPNKINALKGLVQESRTLIRDLRAAVDEIHADLDLTPGMRSLLRHLASSGPATVPQIARSRGVSRQHIQVMINRFQERGLVKSVPNPRHQRSHLVRLRKAGRKLVAELDRRERKIWRLVDLRIKRRDLEAATGALSGVTAMLRSEDWEQAVVESLRQS